MGAGCRDGWGRPGDSHRQNGSGRSLVFAGDELEIRAANQFFFRSRCRIEQDHVDIVERGEFFRNTTRQRLILNSNLLPFLECHTRKVRTFRSGSISPKRGSC